MATRQVTPAELRAALEIGMLAIDAGGEYLYARVLGDGRMLHLLPWSVGGVQVSVGLGDGYYTDTWIFDVEQYEAGWRAALGWDGRGEPEGWYRHPQSGRRRPDGDPAKEFIRP